MGVAGAEGLAILRNGPRKNLLIVCGAKEIEDRDAIRAGFLDRIMPMPLVVFVVTLPKVNVGIGQRRARARGGHIRQSLFAGGFEDDGGVRHQQ